MRQRAPEGANERHQPVLAVPAATSAAGWYLLPTAVTTALHGQAVVVPRRGVRRDYSYRCRDPGQHGQLGSFGCPAPPRDQASYQDGYNEGQQFAQDTVERYGGSKNYFVP